MAATAAAGREQKKATSPASAATLRTEAFSFVHRSDGSIVFLIPRKTSRSSRGGLLKDRLALPR